MERIAAAEAGPIDEAEAMVMAISDHQYKDVEPVFLWGVEHLRELRTSD
ncbi:hypothetical protein [Corallococcus sp. RDP092CA]